MSFGVAEPLRKAGHALPVDDAVRDQPHRPADQVGAQIPLRRPGVASGRHRLQARNPAPCAAAAVAKNRTFSRFGVRAGQLGRQ